MSSKRKEKEAQRLNSRNDEENIFVESDEFDINSENFSLRASGGPVIVPSFVSEKINIREFQSKIMKLVQAFKNELEDSELSNLDCDISTDEMKQYPLDQSLLEIFDEFYPLSESTVENDVAWKQKKKVEERKKKNGEPLLKRKRNSNRNQNQIEKGKEKEIEKEKEREKENIITDGLDQSNKESQMIQINQSNQVNLSIQSNHSSTKVNQVNQSNQVNQVNQVNEVNEVDQTIQFHQNHKTNQTNSNEPNNQTNSNEPNNQTNSSESTNSIHQNEPNDQLVQAVEFSQVNRTEPTGSVDQTHLTFQMESNHQVIQNKKDNQKSELDKVYIASMDDEMMVGNGRDGHEMEEEEEEEEEEEDEDEDAMFLNLANQTLRKYSLFSPSASSSMIAEEIREGEEEEEEREGGGGEGGEEEGEVREKIQKKKKEASEKFTAVQSYENVNTVIPLSNTNETNLSEEKTEKENKSKENEDGRNGMHVNRNTSKEIVLRGEEVKRKRKRNDKNRVRTRKSDADEYRRRVEDEGEKRKEQLAKEKIKKVTEIINKRKLNSSLHSVKEWKSSEEKELSFSNNFKKGERKKMKELSFSDVISDITIQPCINHSTLKNNIHNDIDFLPIDKNEIIITIQILNPEKNYSLSEEISVLGSQTLTFLKDKIYCLFDLLANDFHQKLPSSFFCIQDVFYNDTRDKSSKDYSLIYQQFNRKERELMREKKDEFSFCFPPSPSPSPPSSSPPASFSSLPSPNEKEKEKEKENGKKETDINLPPVYSSKKMQFVKFNELNIQIGSKYAYLHLGGCKHAIVFSDIRLIHPFDVQNYNSYPLVTFSNKVRRRKCQVCEIFASTKIVYDDKLAAESPFYLCEQCYFHLHYSENNSILYSDFQVYNYRHE